MKLSRSGLMLVLSVILCVISMIGASCIQTSGGKVVIKKLSWESPSGHLLSGILYRPESATKNSPAPAIVTIEGWYNNKEMQDLYSVEYARRGFVVLALDMHGHGNSESLPAPSGEVVLDSISDGHLYDGAVGVDGAVQLVATWPYVDKTRIGVTGHSSGGTASNMAIYIDNKRETPLIAANLLQAGDWQDDLGNDHSGDFGSRSVGIIASLYDDFYFWDYDADGNATRAPRDFIQSDEAKKFLNFNVDSPSFSGAATAGMMYEKDFDGKKAYRVIFTPDMIHPRVAFSATCVGYGIEFFEKVFGAPNPIAPDSQIWPWKTFFNFIGLAGFFIFMVAFTLAMLKTGFFSDLQGAPKPQEAPKGVAKVWFWVMLVISMIFSGTSYMWAIAHVYSHTTDYFPQTGPLTIGTWAVLCGVFGIVLMLVYYYAYGKKHGFSLKDTGVCISVPKLGKTVLLALIAVWVTYGLVFLADYFFRTDFRLWVLAVKAFDADKVIIALHYAPLFLLFYIVNSVSFNCFNYNRLSGKGEWLNIFVLALSNVLAVFIIMCAQYLTFFKTGYSLWHATEGARIGPIWIFPILIILFGAAYTSRIIYKRTGNPYLGGIINGLVVTVVSVSNTTTILGAATLIATAF